MAKHDLSSHHFQRKISDFCEVRIAPIASKRMLQSTRTFLIGLGLDAIIRWLGEPPAAEDMRSAKPRAKSKKAILRKSETVTRSRPQQIPSDKIPAQSSSMPRGPQPKPISPFPEPLFEVTDDPASFHDALVYQMRRFGES